MAYSLAKPEPFETTPYTYLKIIKGDDNFTNLICEGNLVWSGWYQTTMMKEICFHNFFVLCRIGHRSSWFMETWVELEELPVLNGLLWKLGPETTRPHCMLGTSPTTFKLMEDL